MVHFGLLAVFLGRLLLCVFVLTVVFVVFVVVLVVLIVVSVVGLVVGRLEDSLDLEVVVFVVVEGRLETMGICLCDVDVGVHVDFVVFLVCREGCV